MELKHEKYWKTSTSVYITSQKAKSLNYIPFNTRFNHKHIGKKHNKFNSISIRINLTNL